MPELMVHSAFQTVVQLAEQRAVHRAFRWFHLQEPKLREWHRAVASIPAPGFSEGNRAAWMMGRFRELGLEDVHLDPCGNALGWIRGESASALKLAPAETPRPCVLLSAHLDTVFGSDIAHEPVQQGSRLQGPGASDNAAGITAMLAIAGAIQAAELRPATDILLAGNVGEEGEGNLRGMRYLFGESPLAARIRSVVVLDGAGTESIVTEALGSQRFRVEITGPGGHSWTDAGAPNPVVVLARALDAMSRIERPDSPRTAWNVGLIEGGTAINAIPQRAEARIDTRSIDTEALRGLEEDLREAVRNAVCEANRSTNRKIERRQMQPLTFQIEAIGERPAARLPENAAILSAIHSVDRHLGIRSQRRIASTDANIPLSLGVEAIGIGGGGTGGGVHTPQEWFDAASRDLALRRILLVLLALAKTEW